MAIDYIVIAKEWRDKINGNSYFSARIENTVENKVESIDKLNQKKPNKSEKEDLTKKKEKE